MRDILSYTTSELQSARGSTYSCYGPELAFQFRQPAFSFRCFFGFSGLSLLVGLQGLFQSICIESFPDAKFTEITIFSENRPGFNSDHNRSGQLAVEFAYALSEYGSRGPVRQGLTSFSDPESAPLAVCEESVYLDLASWYSVLIGIGQRCFFGGGPRSVFRGVYFYYRRPTASCFFNYFYSGFLFQPGKGFLSAFTAEQTHARFANVVSAGKP